MALDSDGELRIVAVRTAQQAHPLDGLQRVPQQVARALQLKGAQTQAIRQAQVAAHVIERPPGGLVLHRAAILLEPGVPLLAAFLRTTVLVEARDGGTRPLRRLPAAPWSSACARTRAYTLGPRSTGSG